MTALEILRGARALIAEKGWTQGVLARDENDKNVHLGGAEACKFCARGAICWSSHWDGVDRDDDVRLADETLERFCDDNIPRWNDAPGRTKDEVLAAFDRAIASLEVAK